MAHLCDFQGDKYKEQEPDSMDLFKECHYSNKTKGYTPAVQIAIVRNFWNKVFFVKFGFWCTSWTMFIAGTTRLKWKTSSLNRQKMNKPSLW